MSSPVALTPMLSQYLAIKARYPDAILFYRMGDFYEMFMEDAVTAAPVLEVQLTSRDRNSPNPIPMCGVPHHSATGYLQKLLAKGFKVAICEQIEDPATAKGIVKRDVVRVITPALIGDPDLVPAEANHYLLWLREIPNAIEATLLDLLGNRLKQGTVPDAKPLLDLFLEFAPKEVLVPEAVADKKWFRDLIRLFPQTSITRRETSLVEYLRETQKREVELSAAMPLFSDDELALDVTTLTSLEVAKLGEVMDFTVTPMGRRTLRAWLSRPLKDGGAIERRHGAVENFVQDPKCAAVIKTYLSGVRDLERLTTKTSLGLAMPRDLVAIRAVLETIPSLKKTLAKAKCPLLKATAKKLLPLEELTATLKAALLDDPPAVYRDGGIFREEYHEEVASLRRLSQDAKGTIASIEERERERTGIHSLKVKYSRVFGYTIEISKSQLGKVPKEYHRKQTIANGERYITDELKRFEEKVVSAEQRLKALEETLFLDLRDAVAEEATGLLANARLIAELDVLQSFGEAARLRGYLRPEMHDAWSLEIDEGRHPVIETLLPPGDFVPNTVTFTTDECRTLIITGPNMAGKSTIMRQVALIAILAHAGSFVPAARAKVPLLDAIFTRIGSSDDLTRGHSTFMVEMTEVARILEKATARSLILIDEIGRGTSTYDGLSLAWSLLEYIHTEIGAKTLFATHFHEVTSLEKALTGVRNVNVLVDNWKGQIVFLHKLGQGVCNQSYGIEVARLASLPPKVLVRAKEILGHLESQARRGERGRHRALEIHENQMGFFDESKRPENQAGLET